jgi:hypothetical protein
LPSFTLAFLGFFLQMQGDSPQTIQGAGGSFIHSQRIWPHSLQGFGGFSGLPIGSSGSAGSPSHSGSAK